MIDIKEEALKFRQKKLIEVMNKGNSTEEEISFIESWRLMFGDGAYRRKRD